MKRYFIRCKQGKAVYFQGNSWGYTNKKRAIHRAKVCEDGGVQVSVIRMECTGVVYGDDCSELGNKCGRCGK